jgi:hypothetical protein
MDVPNFRSKALGMETSVRYVCGTKVRSFASDPRQTHDALWRGCATIPPTAVTSFVIFNSLMKTSAGRDSPLRAGLRTESTARSLKERAAPVKP